MQLERTIITKGMTMTKNQYQVRAKNRADFFRRTWDAEKMRNNLFGTKCNDCGHNECDTTCPSFAD